MTTHQTKDRRSGCLRRNWREIALGIVGGQVVLVISESLVVSFTQHSATMDAQEAVKAPDRSSGDALDPGLGRPLRLPAILPPSLVPLG